MKAVISAIVAYSVTRVFFSMVGFHYDLWNDPFNLINSVIDIGAFAAVYLATNMLLQKFLPTGNDK